MQNSKQRSRWGRAKFGGSPALLIIVSLGAGLLLSLLLSALSLLVGSHEAPAWVLALTALVFWPITFALVWAVLVDRNTIEGATKNPNQSIESRWYSKAAETTFHAMILLLGAGAGLATIFDWNFPTGMVLAVATGGAMVIFFISYQLHKRSAV